LTAVQINVIIYGRRFVMLKTKLTVRVEKDLLENIKRYAERNNTTLTDLIDIYLRRIPSQGSLVDAPIVKRLSGTISKKVSVQDYKDHLEDKYAK